jgi:hypothetical protein
MRQHSKAWFFAISTILIACSVMAAVRGYESMYVGGTLSGIEKGLKGRLDTGDKALSFSPGKGAEFEIPYGQITAMDYGEHAGRRVAAAIFVAWPLLFSHKKRHYLTVYFNRDETKATEQREQIAKDPGLAPTGDVAAFEVNKAISPTMWTCYRPKPALR